MKKSWRWKDALNTKGLKVNRTRLWNRSEEDSSCWRVAGERWQESCDKKGFHKDKTVVRPAMLNSTETALTKRQEAELKMVHFTYVRVYETGQI